MPLKPAAAALLILSASCSSPPPDIQALLDAPDIDVRRLDEIFAVEPGDLRLASPMIEPVGFARPRGPWVLTNQSARPVWLKKAELRVAVEFVPFLPPPERYGGVLGGRSTIKLTAPTFNPDEWVSILPHQQIDLEAPPTTGKPGTYVYRVRISRNGAQLCWQARDWVAQKAVARPMVLSEPLLTSELGHLVLPALTAPPVPWHDFHPVEPQRLPDGRWALQTDLDMATESPGTLEVEAFVVDDRERLTFRGLMKGESQTSQTIDTPGKEEKILRLNSIYSLPESPAPGSYRILFRALQAEPHFLFAPFRIRHACEASPAANSGWIPFEVK